MKRLFKHRPRKPLTGTKPGPLQRQVLITLHVGKRAGYVKGFTAEEIARILSAAIRPDGTHVLVVPASVKGALSGMMVQDGRYWVCKGPYDRWMITRNGQAWL